MSKYALSPAKTIVNPLVESFSISVNSFPSFSYPECPVDTKVEFGFKTLIQFLLGLGFQRYTNRILLIC